MISDVLVKCSEQELIMADSQPCSAAGPADDVIEENYLLFICICWHLEPALQVCMHQKGNYELLHIHLKCLIKDARNAWPQGGVAPRPPPGT